LAVAGGACPRCGELTTGVDDVIEELAAKVTADGGSVQPVRVSVAPIDVAARRRVPPPGARPFPPRPRRARAAGAGGAPWVPGGDDQVGHYGSCRLWSLIIRWSPTSSRSCGTSPRRLPRSAGSPTNW